MKKEIDPITTEIIQSSLQAACDEMFIAMRKTAMSSIIYEVLDFGTAITDSDGNIAASGAGIPAFIAMCDKAVQAVIKKYDNSDIKEGDVFATNDPYNGGVTHLNDVIVVMPIFSSGERIAWSANIAHWPDLGGMAPGGISADAKEIFQEGLQLPVIKMIEKGKPIQSVIDIITANSRIPQYTLGDMWAAIASIRVGEIRIKEIANKYGTETFKQSVQLFMDYGEQASLDSLKKLPKGTFYGEDLLDDGKKIQVKVTITDKEFLVDLRNNPKQDDGPNNASLDGTIVSAQMAFKSISTGDFVCNAGTFRPLKVIADEGSMFNPTRPAAQGIYYETDIRSYDLIWKAISGLNPEKSTAGSFASICGTFMGGQHPDTGATFIIIEPQVGGWGAYSKGDGCNANFSAFHGDTFNTPAEISEARHGVYVDQMRLNDEDGGEGKFRGGKGIIMDYRIRSKNAWVTVAYTRSKSLPWALQGGNEGAPNYIEHIKKDGTINKYSVITGLTLEPEDIIRIHTGSGGGFGKPEDRDSKLIEEDLLNEYITFEQAKKFYNYKK
ncbi:MAG: Acetophenone carboxylase delta subunit [Alphaproteobacteria bacterium MarineAlpha5_Bin9]|nr:MAG: Acetophenone carboxylase delta subunit [Alphaproteobacteria bacterium MarineAlpha5_Bin9]|tara:strand:+ start:25542 stop:27200 length:1659 start_codon:yes stop_codon:yes gene_type:complete